MSKITGNLETGTNFLTNISLNSISCEHIKDCLRLIEDGFYPREIIKSVITFCDDFISLNEDDFIKILFNPHENPDDSILNLFHKCLDRIDFIFSECEPLIKKKLIEKSVFIGMITKNTKFKKEIENFHYILNGALIKINNMKFEYYKKQTNHVIFQNIKNGNISLEIFKKLMEEKEKITSFECEVVR